MIEQLISEEASDFSLSVRWKNQDHPGSAQIKELHERLASPEKYRAFRELKEGEYLLSIIEAFEEAFNDDWLPYEIVGLPLEKAKEFISIVAKELRQNTALEAVNKLRHHYERLSMP